ncbi:kinetochore protein NUF2 homolog [Vigna unguiculata]|uniref:Kinetochore protein Nuf2 n=1 Tax=Vigna unguiculata TaxID=3917 RepID=A0A4D6L7Z5_VIGUN|nr:kinetochore protein NUF2 homolog [Vigna unguiculata]QCD84600.1 kinetochore protein Nuf2 [Vigna unguiculata]
MAASNYEYPRLQRPEIVTILGQFQIANVTEQELAKPNPDLISDLYTRVLFHLDVFLEEDNEQLDFDALEHLENPDLHVESARAVKLFNRIKEVLTDIECPRKFTFADLLVPDPHRTDLFLGALLNFYLYRDTKMNIVSEIVNEFNALEVQQEELQNTMLQLEREIAECNEAREREMPLVQEEEAKVNELKQSIVALNKHQSSLRSTCRKLKDRTAEMDEKISNAEFTLVQSVQENANLRSQIAQSPDKVQRALEEKKLAREEARNAERLARQAFHEKTTVVEVVSKVYKKMSKHYKLMQDIQEQVNSGKSTEKELKTLKAKISDDEMLEKSLEARLVETKSKVEQMEELMKQTEKECNTLGEEATKYLSNTKSEVESNSSTIETRQRNVEAVLSEVDAVNSEIASVKESAAVEVERLRRKCEELVEAFHKYANPIADVIESGQKRLEATQGVGSDI